MGTSTVHFLWQLLSLRFHVEEGGSFRGQVYLLTPASAAAGATVTLSLTVHAHNTPESNYAVAYLTVVPLVRNRKHPEVYIM